MASPSSEYRWVKYEAANTSIWFAEERRFVTLSPGTKYAIDNPLVIRFPYLFAPQPISVRPPYEEAGMRRVVSVRLNGGPR